MKANSLVNFFTLVSFLVLNGIGHLSFADVAPIDPEKVDAAAQKKAERLCGNNGWKAAKYIDEATCKLCIETPGLPACEKDNDNNDACKEAFSDWNKDRADAAEACDSIGGDEASGVSIDKTKRCSDQIKQCQDLMKGTSPLAPSSDDRDEDTLDLLKQLALQRVAQGNPNAAASNSSVNCIGDLTSSKASDAQDKLRQRRKDLEKEKKDLEEDVLKERDEQNKKDAEIKKDIQQLERETKEKLRNVDVKMREQLTQASKSTVDSGKRIRDLGSKMTAANDKIRQIQFQAANRQLSLTAEKINIACKAAINKATSCMVKSIKGQSLDSDKECAQFPLAQMTAKKGSKATAELKQKLEIINKQCYEDANQNKKNDEFATQEQLKKIGDEIVELQNALNDEKKQQEIAANDSQKIQQESQKEKDENSTDLANQINALNNELIKFIENSNAKMTAKNQQLVELLQKLEQLSLDERTGGQSQIAMASKAVNTTRAKGDQVAETCGCVEDSKTGKVKGSGKSAGSDTICARFGKANPDKLNIPEKKKRGSGSSKSTK